MTKNILQINIKDGDDELAILADFLRNGQITSRAIMALRAFYLSLAISESPTSTKEDIRTAEHYCLSQLKQQMCYIMDKHYREDGIKIDADEFSTVTINQAALSDFGLSTQPLPLVGVASQNENRQVLTSAVESSSQPLNLADKEEIAKVAIDTLPPVTEEEEDEEENEDDDYDPYENMTDEEYLAATAHSVSTQVIK